jgi:hypothetical protein
VFDVHVRLVPDLEGRDAGEHGMIRLHDLRGELARSVPLKLGADERNVRR